MRYLVIAILAIAALSGCQRHRAEISFVPAALKDCAPNNVASVVEVRWDARQANTKNGVKLWINNDPTPKRRGVFGGDPGTLWTQGANTGSATTGQWAFPGTTIIVTDAITDDILASVKIPSAPCK